MSSSSTWEWACGKVWDRGRKGYRTCAHELQAQPTARQGGYEAIQALAWASAFHVHGVVSCTSSVRTSGPPPRTKKKECNLRDSNACGVNHWCLKPTP